MRKRKVVYFCDHCGKAEVEMPKLRFDGPWISRFPEGWTKLGREHLCPKCSEIYRKLKEETDDE